MKTTKLYSSILLITLATTVFGIHQRLQQNEVYVVHGIRDIATENNDISLQAWMSTPFEEVIVESWFIIEDWMLTPFDIPSGEEAVCLEEWMTAPFVPPLEDDRIVLENWMITPFEDTFKEEKLELEEWMTRPIWG